MFSIAAINDTDSRAQWEPLAPTKEAQEFHLSQTYHDALLKLEAKDYTRARELFEAVLKDPIISNSQAANNASDGHLLQLRFLSLKNLATVFLQQGPIHYDNALQCYIQAVEIDANDSVVWNQLGTLSCTMGLFSTSRWAFENGLQCSPNNWNCMEKLLEILIAIGDEVACLSVADLILRHWPSHSRALHVKRTIENAEPVPFAPRGIDKLEPKHIRLKFPAKRKSEDGELDEKALLKRHKQGLELQVAGATWAALTDAILSIFLPIIRQDPEPGIMHDDAFNGKMVGTQGNAVAFDENMERLKNVKINICLAVGSAEGKVRKVCPVRESASLISSDYDETSTKESYVDKEHTQERRSTRLERLRSRKSGKEELEFSSSKDQGKVVFKFLEPFILNKSGQKVGDNFANSYGPSANIPTYSTDLEYNDVTRFMSRASKNLGAYHLGHLLLEEVAHIDIPFQDSFVKFLELEKLTRHCGQDRTPLCSLFLAEVYYDQGSSSANESKRSDLFSEASYNLCRVIELLALDSSYDMADISGPIGTSRLSAEVSDPIKRKLPSYMAENENMPLTSKSDNLSTEIVEDSLDNSLCQESAGQNQITINSTFWVRFFWLSGRLSLYSGSKKKAFNEFCNCLSLLTSSKTVEGNPDSVFLPHCNFVRLLTVDRILHEINLLNLDALDVKTMEEMIEKGMYTECVELISPLVLSSRDSHPETVASASKESKRVLLLELSALDILMSACEKAEPKNLDVYLNCHRRKLQVLTAAAGMVCSITVQKDASSLVKPSVVPEMDSAEASDKNWVHMVAEEVKDISRSVSRMKKSIDQSDTHRSPSSLNCIISDIQSLLLTVMSNAVRTILIQKCSGTSSSVSMDQFNGSCLVDAAIAFCKLQHLDPSISIKAQVDLIVAIHDLLAEYGLCCAGRDSKGEEGIFLKLAIKHLLALDMKLKALTGPNGKEEVSSPNKDVSEVSTPERNIACEERDKDEEESKKSTGDFTRAPSQKTVASDTGNIDADLEELELGIDNALDQSFFCLYGLNINPDSSSEDDLAIHKNTSRGDYQTKEQCADVFQYILPYARALSRAGLIKLRRVFRAIRKHFPQPPDDILAESAIDKFLDSPDLLEDKLSEVSRSEGTWESIMNILFTDGREPETFKKLSAVGSAPYFEVYSNLYYLIAQAEDTSATDKYAGFVLRKEGEEFVEQSANLFKYDLLYNPLRFESWQKLANIYDEEVDLLLNDGSKHINIMDWRKNSSLPQRVEIGRRRSRRCLLMSLSLAKTPIQQSQIHELLALVYYDSLQNVVPFYDQRSTVPTKDAMWTAFSRNSMKHFEKAFALKPEWLHAFYLGKLCEKLGKSPDKAFSYYSKAGSLNPSAVDPVYRMHASRLKLLHTRGKQNLNILQIIGAYSFNQSTKEVIQIKLGCTSLDVKDVCPSDNMEVERNIETHLLEEAWHLLFDDCISALEICVEGELKHYHKVRYMLAQGLYKKGELGDMERAKEELSFCFKSSRSSFTINMWEIDGATKKGRRKYPGHGGNKRNLEVSLSESSRKFISCIRKYILLYLNLLEKTGDLSTLERAYIYLRTDKRFSLCLGDIVPVALGKYIQVLTSSINNAENLGSTDSNSLEQMLERMFNIFIDHVNLWADISSLPEVNNPDLSESCLYGYIHRYIQLLESDMRLEALEGINEKIRKRFKNPKLSSSNFSKICRHASLAWCRCILFKLASITPVSDSVNLGEQAGTSETGLQPYVDLQPDEFLSSSAEGSHSKGLDLNLYQALSRIKNVHIQRASEGNLEAAANLMRCTYNFYRDSSCALPSGVNLYTVYHSPPSAEGLQQLDKDRVEVLDLSIPRKLLLWAYILVHGRYSNISTVVKYCEENAKSRLRRGVSTSSAPSQANTSVCVAHAGISKEKSDRSELGEAEDNPHMASTSVHQEDVAPSVNSVVAPDDTQKTSVATSQLQRCSSSKGE